VIGTLDFSCQNAHREAKLLDNHIFSKNNPGTCLEKMLFIARPAADQKSRYISLVNAAIVRWNVTMQAKK
jgi:hypothetical protein